MDHKKKYKFKLQSFSEKEGELESQESYHSAKGRMGRPQGSAVQRIIWIDDALSGFGHRSLTRRIGRQESFLQ